MRDRRGTRGDLRDVSIRTSRGLVIIGLVGLDELSDLSSSVTVLEVCVLEGGPASCSRSDPSETFPDMGDIGRKLGVMGRGLLGRPGLLRGGV